MITIVKHLEIIIWLHACHLNKLTSSFLWSNQLCFLIIIISMRILETLGEYDRWPRKETSGGICLAKWQRGPNLAWTNIYWLMSHLSYLLLQTHLCTVYLTIWLVATEPWFSKMSLFIAWRKSCAGVHKLLTGWLLFLGLLRRQFQSALIIHDIIITTAVSYTGADDEGGKLWSVPFCWSPGPSVNAKQLINDTQSHRWRQYS